MTHKTGFSTLPAHTPVDTALLIMMTPQQLSSYLSTIDWPSQLQPTPDLPSLYLLQARHLTNLPYQSRYSVLPRPHLPPRDLHLHRTLPRPTLEVEDLLRTLSTRGGHCYQVRETCIKVVHPEGGVQKLKKRKSMVFNHPRPPTHD